MLADDNEPVRKRLGAFLRKQPDFEVVGEAVDGNAAVRLAHDLQPDVVVMDVMMPGLNGIEATRKIKGESPVIKVIALSLHGDDGYRRAMLDAGAETYLLKDNAMHELPKMLNFIATGTRNPGSPDKTRK